MSTSEPVHEIILLTRFCLNARNALAHIGGLGRQFSNDVLSPSYLKYRFALLDCMARQSVRQQTNQNFRWIILIDSGLNASWRRKMQSFCAKSNAELVFFHQGMDLEYTDWITDKSESCELLVTINQDDDDLLPETYVDAIDRLIKGLHQKNELPPIGIISTTKKMQWDLNAAGAHVYGQLAPWTEQRPRFASTGLTLFCNKSDFDLSVLGIDHSFVDDYFDFEQAPEHPNVAFFRDILSRQSQRWNPELLHRRYAAFVFDIAHETAPVIIVNHNRNVQAYRLRKRKVTTVEISDPEHIYRRVFDFSLLPGTEASLMQSLTSRFIQKLFPTRTKQASPALPHRFFYSAPGADPLRDLHQILSPSAQTFFDIGAYDGRTTVSIKDIWPDAEVYCFEPNDMVMDIVEKRTRHLTGIHLQRSAISDRDGSLTFTDKSHRYFSRALYPGQDLEPYRNQFSAGCTTIDTFCDRAGIPSIDLIAIDVVEHEDSVLSGATIMLSTHRIRALLITIYALQDEQIISRLQLIAEIMERHGYSLSGLYSMQHNWIERTPTLMSLKILYISPDLVKHTWSGKLNLHMTHHK